MEKTFTLDDLKSYFQEVQSGGKKMHKREHKTQGPDSMVLQNILNYSRALEVLKTSKAGTFYHLAN